MAIAKFCERCGSVWPGEKIKKCPDFVIPVYHSEYRELCNGCAASLGLDAISKQRKEEMLKKFIADNPEMMDSVIKPLVTPVVVGPVAKVEVKSGPSAS